MSRVGRGAGIAVGRARALAMGMMLCPAGAWAAVVPIPVVAAEAVYGAAVEGVAGDAAAVTSVLRNPAQDPHLFEAGPAAARAVAQARLVIENGAGYDPWMDGLLASSPLPGRAVLVVADLVHAPVGVNPHLWVSPAVMRTVVQAVAAALTRIDPDKAPIFDAGRKRLLARLDVLDARVAAMRARFGGQSVAATEPVFGPMLAALGLKVRDARFQLAVMNDAEPRASDEASIEADLRGRRVRALLVNAQVSDGLTERLAGIARAAGVPVVAVGETLPAGEDYTAWMLGQLTALGNALAGPTP